VDPLTVSSGAPTATIVSLDGEFDLADRVRLQDMLMVAAASPTVVMNFEKTKYVDSSILQCVVALRKVLQEREAQLVVVGLHDGVSRLFEVCQFEQIFDIRQSVDDAVAKDFGSANVRQLTLLGAGRD
jgi:anti-anti-sigma factor